MPKGTLKLRVAVTGVTPATKMLRKLNAEFNRLDKGTRRANAGVMRLDRSFRRASVNAARLARATRKAGMAGAGIRGIGGARAAGGAAGGLGAGAGVGGAAAAGAAGAGAARMSVAQKAQAGFWVKKMAFDKTQAAHVGVLQKSHSANLRLIAGTVALGYAATRAVKNFASFDKALREVSTVADFSADQFLEFRKQTAAIAASLGTDRVETAGAAYEAFSRRTKDAGKALELTKIASKAAVAGLTDARESMKLIIGVMNAFSHENLTAVETFDKLFAAVRVGGVTFDGLTGSLGRLTSIAAKTGVSSDEMLAALATVTDAGVQEEIAVTALRAALLAIVTPTSRAGKLAQKLGFDMSFAGVQAGGLTHVIEGLNAVYDKEKGAVVELIPEARALAGVLNLVGEGANEYKRDLEAVTNATGEGEKAFQKMAGSMSMSGARLSNTYKKLTDSVVEFFEIDIKTATDHWANALDKFDKKTSRTRAGRDKDRGFFGELMHIAGNMGPGDMRTPSQVLQQEGEREFELNKRLANLKRVREGQGGGGGGGSITINVAGDLVTNDLNDVDVTGTATQ